MKQELINELENLLASPLNENASNFKRAVKLLDSLIALVKPGSSIHKTSMAEGGKYAKSELEQLNSYLKSCNSILLELQIDYGDS